MKQEKWKKNKHSRNNTILFQKTCQLVSLVILPLQMNPMGEATSENNG